ncbi:MAG TPA: histidine kinase, partial [Bryobacteraceae bacterium]
MRSTGPAPDRKESLSTLLSTHEEQNKSLARELHDVVSQKLAALGMEIDAIQRNPPESTEELRGRLRRLSDGVTTLAKTMHEISRQLHPAILDDLGLVEALRSECLLFGEVYQSPVSFRADHVAEGLPDSVILCLYRIAQESLRNIGKHARHAAASVTLTGTNSGIKLSIEDTGPGGLTTGKGLGLISMKERARLVNGKLRME